MVSKPNDEDFGLDAFLVVLFSSLFVCGMLSFGIEGGLKEPEVAFVISPVRPFRIDGHLCSRVGEYHAFSHHPNCPCGRGGLPLTIERDGRSRLEGGWERAD